MPDTSTAQRRLVAAEVRAWMGRLRVTQTELAAILEKSQPYVSRRLSGEVAFDTDDLFKLADYFDVTAAALLAPGDADRLRRGVGEAAADPATVAPRRLLLNSLAA